MKNGLPDNFLLPERRQGYYVSENRKRLWAAEIDILLKIDSVCWKNGIKYFLYGGTLLGAVRDKGFIPWDDDVDVLMLREDYDRFMELSWAFQYPYFMQTFPVDNHYGFRIAKIRNSNTTAFELDDIRDGLKPFNQGVFVDIFPYDYVPDDDEKLKKYDKEVLRFQKKYYRWKPDFTVEEYAHYQQVLRRYSYTKTKRVADLIVRPHKKLTTCSVEAFNKQKMVLFEGLPFPVPEGYDELLTNHYGEDWRIPKRAKAFHSGLYVDTNHSYRYYLENPEMVDVNKGKLKL